MGSVFSARESGLIFLAGILLLVIALHATNEEITTRVRAKANSWLLPSSSGMNVSLDNSTSSSLIESDPLADDTSPIFNTTQLEQIGCLKHDTISVEAQLNHTKVMLEMKMGEGCAPLRREWRNNPPLSEFAKAIYKRQSDCSLPTVAWGMNNRYGIGSYVGQWSEAMCTAMDNRMRLRTEMSDWMWLDQSHCNMTDAATRSPWLCYFPKMEFLCEQVQEGYVHIGNMASKPCSSRQNDPVAREAFRSASIEYMFGQVSPLLISEAQRQIGVIFGPNGAPEDLITVHVRWGDKGDEMKLVTVEEYINATTEILMTVLNRTADSPANVFLATEDPEAVRAFLEKAPSNWKIYRDLVVDELDRFRPPETYNSASIMTKNTRGRGGLVNMGSLLVSMEANYFVLTTASGWSRMMNHIRKSIIDPRCRNCTHVIDLRPRTWR